MRKSTLFFLLLTTCLSGCPKGESALEWGAELHSPDPAITRMLEEAGERAALLIVLRPDRWPDASETLQSYLANLPIEASINERVLSAPDGVAALLGALTCLDDETRDWPREFEGLDISRPVIAALFETNRDFLCGAVKLATGPGASVHLPGIRHRIMIPSTEQPVLIDSLKKFLVRTGLEPVPISSHGKETAAGLLFAFPSKEGGVALVPRELGVDVEILHHWYERRAGSDLLMQLTRKRQRARLMATPALHRLAGGEDILAAYFRPWLLRDLGTQIGISRLLNALGHADPAQRRVLLAAGFSEVLTGMFMMSPLGAEIDDSCLGISVDDGIRITLTSSLTELGARAYWSSLEGLSTPYIHSKIPSLLTLSIPANLGNLLEHVRVPSWLKKTKDTYELFRAYRECGLMCAWHTLLRSPVGFSKALRRFARFDSVQHLPRTLHLSLVDLDIENQQKPFRAAMAASLAKGYDTTWLREMLKEIEKPRHTGGWLKTKLVLESRGNSDVVMIGFNIDPREVYTARSTNPPRDELGRFTFDVAALAENLPECPAETAAFMNQISPLRGRSLLCHRAMITELAAGVSSLSATENKESVFETPDDYRGLKWNSPGLQQASSKGGRCLAELGRNTVETLQWFSFGPVSERVEAMTRALGPEVEKQLICAMKDESSKSDAVTLDLVRTPLFDYLLAEDKYRKLRTRLLEGACSRGVEEACNRRGPETGKTGQKFDRPPDSR